MAAYIHLYKTLPPNYITKGQANKLGWKTKGSLDQVAPGKSIGGDRDGNYEKKLPDKQGRTWKPFSELLLQAHPHFHNVFP